MFDYRDLPKGVSPRTAAVHGGQLPSPYMENAEAIYLTSGFTYPTAEEAEAAFKGDIERYVYSRYANPTTSMFEERLRLLELLFDGAHCVSELADETGASMPTVSHRLKVLSSARLLSRERRGKHIYYALADEHVRYILDALFAHAAE